MSVKQSIYLKKEVLIRIIRAFFSGDFLKNIRLIPFDMRPRGMEVSYRCCIYKERAVLRERIIAGLGFAIEDDDEAEDLSDYAKKALSRVKPSAKPLTIAATACKGCVKNRVYVTDICQGCVARMCGQVCKFGAVNFINGKSVIDAAKCKNCKMCVAVCPYKAIAQTIVPCEEACPVDAIKKNEAGFAQIDYERCILCGKCIAGCPFGAVHEKSWLIDVLKHFNSGLTEKDGVANGKNIIALIAPSIAGQFPGNIYQLKSAIIQTGFSDVYEVACGADITIKNEAVEFDERMEKGAPFMTTSCCAGYKQFAGKHLPEIAKFMSHTQTPLYYIAQKVKEAHPDAITVFISPCAAKKIEAFYNANVDYVINYEELGALFIAKNIEILNCKETKYDVESSKQGRNFAVSSGVAAAVASLAKTPIKPYIINGLNRETINSLKKAAKEQKIDGNLVEVMCCENGCIGGNAAICAPKVAQKAIKALVEISQDIKDDTGSGI
ncbi:MAG: monomeric [FeFe] hydrogenase [Endomicrobium sp.]|jgi:[FeFe] hydrogenase (group B1/B3)|nr:monomeric [FeFe] hydrogenase [Endomicrobium sp.]